MPSGSMGVDENPRCIFLSVYLTLGLQVRAFRPAATRQRLPFENRVEVVSTGQQIENLGPRFRDPWNSTPHAHALSSRVRGYRS